MINILKLIYIPYNLKLRMSLCFFAYFVLALILRLVFLENIAKYIFLLFIISMIFWLVIFPGLLDKLTEVYCKSFEYIYMYIFRKDPKVIKILNLIYNIRNIITRGHSGKLFVYNMLLTVLLLVNIPYISVVRLVLGGFLLLGAIIDIIHQCFMFYGYKGEPAYKGKWRDRYRYLEWDNKQSVLMQVRYNQIVLQRLHYMFEDEGLPFYSREILFYGFRPAYRLDCWLRKIFGKVAKK